MPTPITSTTQDHLPVYDIQERLVIFRNGSAAMIIETTAVNFGLLSEQEQDAIIYAYAALLNSLNFPIQILIRSERKDISAYLTLLTDAAKKQSSPTKRVQIESYRTFIAETVQRKNVLDKKFYIVLPFSALELGTIKSLGNAVSSNSRLPVPLPEVIKKATTSLTPKRDHILRQMERIGLTAHQLSNREALSLIFRTYNPGASAPLVGPEQLTSAFVKPMVKQENK